MKNMSGFNDPKYGGTSIYGNQSITGGPTAVLKPIVLPNYGMT